MKPTLSFLFTIAVMSLGAACLAQEKQADAANGTVSFIVRPEYSRILMFFRGPLKHTHDLRGDTLTVSISDIKSPASNSVWRRQFPSGEIACATVGPIVNGRAKIVLTLRDGNAKFKIVEHDRHESIWIDVYSRSAGPATKVAAAAPSSIIPNKTITAKSANQSTASLAAKRMEDKAQQQPVHQTPVIDISALVRQQLEETEPGTRPKRNGKGSELISQEPSISAQTTGGGKKSLLWLVVVCFTLMTSAVVMVLLVKRAKKRSMIVAQLLATKAALASSEPIGSLDRKSDQFPETERVQSSSVIDEPLDAFGDEGTRTRSLAERYHRSQGDIELAMKLRDGARHQTHVGVAKTIGATKVPAKASVSAARKLGVGTGELDLASKLLRLAIAQSEKEKVE